jgi:hypothetical protein
LSLEIIRGIHDTGSRYLIEIHDNFANPQYSDTPMSRYAISSKGRDVETSWCESAI